MSQFPSFVAKFPSPTLIPTSVMLPLWPHSQSNEDILAVDELKYQELVPSCSPIIHYSLFMVRNLVPNFRVFKFLLQKQKLKNTLCFNLPLRYLFSFDLPLPPLYHCHHWSVNCDVLRLVRLLLSFDITVLTGWQWRD